MIKSITVTNEQNESIKLELTNPESSGFMILEVDGLGPPKANINITDLATNDGGVFNSSRITSRNIVIQLKFLWKPTIEHSRQLSYKYFQLKKRVMLTIETDLRTSKVYGRVESNEPNIFSDSQGTQISIICPSAYLYAKDPILTVFSGVTPLFEFPFENESESPVLLMGDIENAPTKNIFYVGESDVGIKAIIHSVGTATNPVIYNSKTRQLMRIDTTRLLALTGDVIIAGDNIEVSTVKGNKYIKLIRNGLETNILSTLDKDVSWINLSQGDNIITFTSDTGSENLQLKVEYTPIYEGV